MLQIEKFQLRSGRIAKISKIWDIFCAFSLVLDIPSHEKAFQSQWIILILSVACTVL